MTLFRTGKNSILNIPILTQAKTEYAIAAIAPDFLLRAREGLHHVARTGERALKIVLVIVGLLLPVWLFPAGCLASRSTVLAMMLSP